MKILSMAWTIYNKAFEAFRNNATGGGLVINNICEYIGRKEESYLFIGSRHIAEQKIGNINFVGTDIKLNDHDNDNVKDTVYLDNMEKKFEMAIERIQPDIVNFHGLGDLMRRCIDICIKMDTPYVYTEHLYIGMSREIEGYQKSVEWEKDLYNVPGLPIIAVSNGIKQKILKDFPLMPESQISVILNGTDFEAKIVESNYRERYSLQGKKVLLCVGTLLARKNQTQLVRAYMKLPEHIRNKIAIVFCGRDSMKGELQRQIKANGLEKDLTYAGVVSSEEMKKFYSIADGLVMPSLAEGLSIAALEAIAYGMPVIMFSDSECAEDLNDEQVVCFANDRSDEELAAAIERWYVKEWDKDYIVEYSKYFTMERMADDYIEYYKTRIENA